MTFSKAFSLAKIAVTSLLLCTASYVHASDLNSLLNTVEERPPMKSPSHMQLMSPEEVKDFNTMIAGSSSSHLDRFRGAISRQFGVLQDSFTNSINSRHEKMVKWAKFHEGISGKVKAGGIILFGVSAVGWFVSLTPIPCDVQNWLSIGSTAGLLTGGAMLWIAKQSVLAVERIDQATMADMGRTLHLESLIDAEVKRRTQEHDGDSSEDEDNTLRGAGSFEVVIDRGHHSNAPQPTILKKKKKSVRIHGDDPLDEEDQRVKGAILKEIVVETHVAVDDKGKEEDKRESSAEETYTVVYMEPKDDKSL